MSFLQYFLDPKIENQYRSADISSTTAVISFIKAKVSTTVSLYGRKFYIRFSSNKMQKDSFSLYRLSAIIAAC